MVMEAAYTPSREFPMSILSDPATVAGAVTTTLLAVVGGIRFAIKTYSKDRVDVTVNSATNQIINTLRDEVRRLSETVTELNKVNTEVRVERDSLRNEVMNLTYAVDRLKDVVVTILGEEAAARQLRERGLDFVSSKVDPDQ
jgi:hypothetical protein